MSDFTFYAGSAIKAAGIFIIRYGSSHGSFHLELNVSVAFQRPR